MQLAKRAGHLCPTLLAAELEKLQRPAEIYISHMKPGLSTLLRFVGIGLQTLSNGSAKLLLPDGSAMFISYTATNEHHYTSLGKLLIAAELSKPAEMSMQKIQEIYKHSPELVQEMMLENDRFVFFTESEGNNWPRGSIGIALTTQASLAMDNTVFPTCGIFLVETSIESASGEPSRYVRLMLNQDTGGAIKGPGRADIYMGVGKKAGDIAGKLKSNGRLFYFLLKSSITKASIH